MKHENMLQWYISTIEIGNNDDLSGWDWGRLLAFYPEYADICQWEKLDGTDWAILLDKHYHFIKYCRWELFDEDDWDKVYKGHPNLRDFIRENKEKYLMLKGASRLKI